MVERVSGDWAEDALILAAAQAIYAVDTQPVTGEHFLLRPEHVQDIYRMFAKAALHSLKVNAAYIRWCEWPDCLRSFNVLNGPDREVDGDGWLHSNSGLRVLLCPDHSGLGHWPGTVEWESGWHHVNMSCGCGERVENLSPSNLGTARKWWAAHVEELAL